MIVVLGYYGFGNLGDEAILATLCQDLEDLGVSREEIVVLSGNPQHTRGQHGVQALGRFEMGKLWRTLPSAHCLIAGGGSLFQDVTSKRSIPYYLSIVELALLRNVPVFMYAQGVGPVRTKIYQRWVRRAFNKSVAYTVRDEASVRFLKELGVPTQLGSLCADPVFQRQGAKFCSPSSRLLLNLRPYNLWPAQRDLWVDLVSHWMGEGWQVEFIPLGPGDRGLALDLQVKLPELRVHSTLELDTVAEVFNGAGLCVSMRLHGIIFAALYGVLPLGLNYDPKVEAISAQLQIPLWELKELPNLRLGLGEVVTQREQYEQDCASALEVLQKLAEGNRTKLAQVLR